jgi:sugar lactone lactonase YvrE
MSSKQSMPEVNVLLTGLVFPESPRWHDGRLWVADWGGQQLVAVDLDGANEVAAKLPSFPSCIDFLPDGRLLMVSAHDGRLLRREQDGTLVTHAELSGLAGHAWNDIVVDDRGNAYVNNIGFDFPGGEFAPGILAMATPDGAARQVADGFAFPNGVAVLADGSTLVQSESYANRLTAFDIDPDGSLSNRRVWAELGEGVPDGICADAEGAVWYADVPNRRCVRVREGGDVLQSVEVDRGCFACMLGGPDGSTLFIVANEWGGAEEMTGGAAQGQVLTVQAPAPHAGRP